MLLVQHSMQPISISTLICTLTHVRLFLQVSAQTRQKCEWRHVCNRRRRRRTRVAYRRRRPNAATAFGANGRPPHLWHHNLARASTCAAPSPCDVNALNIHAWRHRTRAPKKSIAAPSVRRAVQPPPLDSQLGHAVRFNKKTRPQAPSISSEALTSDCLLFYLVCHIKQKRFAAATGKYNFAALVRSEGVEHVLNKLRSCFLGLPGSFSLVS